VKKLQSLGTITALSVATVFALTQPAKAILTNTFQFTDENGFGTGRVTGGIVTGTITFNSLNPGDSATGVAANSIVVDSIPSWAINSSGLWNDSPDMSLGVELTQFINGETADFSTGIFETNTWDIVNGTIVNGSFLSIVNNQESVALSSNDPNSPSFIRSYVRDTNGGFEYMYDNNSSSLTFSEASASVPFEFSPTLGLLLVSSLFGVSRYAKSRKAAKLIDN
jgi:hypothetical protein